MATTVPVQTSTSPSEAEVKNIGQINYPVRLLVVDSIAAPLRRDFGTDSAPQRAAAIFQCAQTLKRLADQLHLAVVVINQVGSADLDPSAAMNTTGGNGFVADHLSVKAALGTSWHHCVSTRVLMESTATIKRHRGGGALSSAEENTENSAQWALPRHPLVVRRVRIVKSNLVEDTETYFEISKTGIVDYRPMEETQKEKKLS
mmetsp:Transcript_9990/g.18222  ORF Transcript_9990/g.18222 Transcript_9990/m.18222 type:complete len:203 (+) Transcript_9990:409-1017(+)